MKEKVEEVGDREGLYRQVVPRYLPRHSKHLHLVNDSRQPVNDRLRIRAGSIMESEGRYVVNVAKPEAVGGAR